MHYYGVAYYPIAGEKLIKDRENGLFLQETWFSDDLRELALLSEFYEDVKVIFWEAFVRRKSYQILVVRKDTNNIDFPLILAL